MSREESQDTVSLRDRVGRDVLPTACLPGWRMRTLTFLSILAHCHLSIAASLASVSTMCLSRYPTKLAGVQHRGLSPHRLGRGPPVALKSYSWAWTWVPLPLISFCPLHSPLALAGFSTPLSPLWDLWLRRLSFNFQVLLLSLTHAHRHTLNRFGFM